MKLANRLLLFVAIACITLGCLALAGLAHLLDNQVVGWAVMVPAIPVGLVASPGWFYSVSDGWPVLTVAGVGMTYFVPGILLLTARRVTRAR